MNEDPDLIGAEYAEDIAEVIANILEARGLDRLEAWATAFNIVTESRINRGE
jgi:hypothetical protein